MGGELTQAQREALTALSPIVGDAFYLAGGVAVALRLHHRSSRDLDLFSSDTDPTDLEEQLANNPAIRIVSRAVGTLHLEAHGVPVSLLRYRYPLLEGLESDPTLPIKLASREDLVCMKLSAIAGRGARRDFWDLHELIAASHLTLSRALELFERKFPRTDRGHVVRSLAYFADADAEPMPPELTSTAWAAIKRDFEAWVLALE
jgi:hypothetical protein